MNELSILLALDGSSQSCHAMNFCFQLAQRHSIKLTAQHVIDSLGLWDFLGFDTPGLIGSGPYLGAHESMRRELTGLGETLMHVYKTRAESAGIDSLFVLDEGSAVREICRQAQEHDLVIMGHRPSGVHSPADERRKFPRHSVAERLCHFIERPLLIIQNPVGQWQSLTVVLSTEQSFAGSLAGCARLSHVFACPLRVVYWLQSDSEENRLPALIASAKKTISPFGELEFSVVTSESRWWMPDMEVSPDSLMVIPATSNGQRETPFGTAPDLLLRHWQRSALLLWPESFAPGLQDAENCISKAVV